MSGFGIDWGGIAIDGKPNDGSGFLVFLSASPRTPLIARGAIVRLFNYNCLVLTNTADPLTTVKFYRFSLNYLIF